LLSAREIAREDVIGTDEDGSELSGYLAIYPDKRI
jgi:hypothetical protein